MLREDPLLVEQFCQYLFITEKWMFPTDVGLCDRCGGPDIRPVQMGKEFAVLMGLCFPCTMAVQKEAATQYSGYLGLAAVYAFGYQAGLEERQSRRAKRAP